MAVALKTETTFLRGCAKAYASEIGFRPEAEQEMREHGIDWPAVHQVLRNDRVVWGEKEDAFGATWTVEGMTCDGDRLRLTVQVFCETYRVLVKSAARL
jgi:hypothetical protein